MMYLATATVHNLNIFSIKHFLRFSFDLFDIHKINSKKS